MAAAVLTALIASACSGSSGKSGGTVSSGSSASGPSPSATVSSSALPASIKGISAARCAQNKAAGKIIFLTPFQYAASVGILDVLAAQQQGYFQALCLNMEIKPGGVNAALVSSGKAQLGGRRRAQ